MTSQYGGTAKYGGTEKIESVSVCAVYDRKTGDIHHWHHCVTIVGGLHPSQDQIAKDALTAAERREGHVKGAFGVLHVDPATETNKVSRVDHERQVLVLQESDVKK
jgi:hypothetical protein